MGPRYIADPECYFVACIALLFLGERAAHCLSVQGGVTAGDTSAYVVASSAFVVCNLRGLTYLILAARDVWCRWDFRLCYYSLEIQI